MHKLFKEIGNNIENKDIPIIVAADFIESTKQELSDYLNGKKGLGFRKLLKFSFLLHPNNQKEVMENWCMRLNSTESMKQSFEYASITRNKELLKKLIDVHQNDEPLSKYVAVYTILYDYYMFKFEADVLPAKLEKVGQLKGELSILADIMKCYHYYYLKEYHLMLATAKGVEKSIYKLSDRHLFIKESYLHRIAEVMGHASVHFNDVESARYYANLIINANICAKTVSGAYDILGMSYLSEDKAKCIQYLQTRYDIAKTIGEPSIEKMARRNLDYAKLYLNITLDTEADPILLRLQNNKGSEFEIKLLKEEIFQQGEDEFLILLRAIAKKSVKSLHKCRKEFFKNWNYLFVSLAAIEAKKAGEDSELIEEFIELKLETKGDVQFEENYIKCFNRISSNRNSISA
jgi:hypothetical protein